MKKRPTYELIKENPLFSTFSNEEIDEMLNNLNYNLRTYTKGRVSVHPG